MVYFIYACYGFGFRKTDTFNIAKKVPVAPAPMMARLPQALLGRENGALAVIGHIDRAWSCSFNVDGLPPQDQGFRDVLMKGLSGMCLGSATDQSNLPLGRVDDSFSGHFTEDAHPPGPGEARRESLDHSR